MNLMNQPPTFGANRQIGRRTGSTCYSDLMAPGDDVILPRSRDTVAALSYVLSSAHRVQFTTCVANCPLAGRPQHVNHLQL